jgi:alpha-glucosidase
MRSHTTYGTPDKEPWSFGFQFEAINKRTIELRYQLLPYIYNVMQQASETGVPALRPVFLEFPKDERAAGMDDEFFFGSDLLVAPVLWENAADREVYLPKGDWYDYWTGHRYNGNSTIHVAVTLDSIPMFVRGGGSIFRQPIVQYTGQMRGKPLRVLMAPAKESESTLYEDDGKSFGYRNNAFMKRTFHQTRDGSTNTVEVSAPEGFYRPATRDLILELWADHEPKSVSLQTGAETNAVESLTRMNAADFIKSPRGWTYSDGMVRAKDKDHFGSMTFTIEN